MIMYILQVTGEISQENHKEFQQSIEFIKAQIKEQGIDSRLTFTSMNKNRFQFDSYWKSKEQMDEFRRDDLYKAIIGAYKVLGIYEGTSISKIN